MPSIDRASAVRVSERAMAIPARPVRAGRLPAIGAAAPGHPLHPYRLLNELDFSQLVPTTFRALVLENDFVELTVLPQLGGRLHRARYKPTGYDLFYHNDAIRAQLVSLRGAWYAGGVEFNFPDSHNLTTHAPVEYATERYPDGSAAILIANTDRATRMRWRVAVRLYPGCSGIHFATRLLNRTAWPQRYYYWLNAAVPQGPQIRYQFAATRLIGHLQEVDGVATRLDHFPLLRNGGDARAPAGLPDTTSVFMLDNHSGFFGYYDTAADIGLVRSAPVRNLPGNKIWSWGDTDYGRRFNRRLLPPDGQFYGELQSGRPESQTDWAMIEPFEAVTAEEWWYPTPALGGLTAGGDTLTAFLDAEGGRARLVSNRPIEKLRVRVLGTDAGTRRRGDTGIETGVEQVFENVRPAEPVEVRLAAILKECGPGISDGPTRILATDSAGRTLLDLCSEKPRRPDSIILDLYESKADEELRPTNTPAGLTVRAVSAIRAYQHRRAEQWCRKAIELDPLYAPARRWLGWLLRRQGRYGQAVEQFKAALLADPMDYAAFYQYAATLAEAALAISPSLAQGEGAFSVSPSPAQGEGRGEGATGSLDFAITELQRVIGYTHGQYRVWAAVLLARCLLAAGRVDEAKRLMAEWPGEVAFGPLGRLAATRGGACGVGPDARSPWWNDPTDLFERVVGSADPKDALDSWWQANLKPPDDAADAVLDVAEELATSGERERVGAVLQWVTAHPVLGAACPMAHYHLGELTGDLVSAVFRAERATDRASMAWVSDPSDEPVLKSACLVADVALPHALLGMLLLSLGRTEEAIQPLRRATDLDPSDALSWRNLGLAVWTMLARLKEKAQGLPSLDLGVDDCLGAYDRAVALWPDYAPLVVEADRMLAQLNGPVAERRRRLHDALHPSLAADASIAIRRAELALVSGDYAAGIAELTEHRFHPGEGGFGTRRLLERLCLRLGERLAGQGDWAAALFRFRASLEYPENLGIGRPRRVREARPRYLIALALERTGDGPGARGELEHLIRLARPGDLTERYFAILARRKLGQTDAAERAAKDLADLAGQPSDAAGANGWRTRLAAALVARLRGDRETSNRLLGELDPGPSDELADLLASSIY